MAIPKTSVAGKSATAFSPGIVVRNRSRLWRVDAQEGNILVATSIDGGETEQTKFYIPARIISTRHRRKMEHELPAGANPWERYRFLITLVDYAKQPGVKNQILEQSWDIVLINEAHQVAKPHQSGPDQRVRMDRRELAEALAASPRVRHLLLLTATPPRRRSGQQGRRPRPLSGTRSAAPSCAPSWTHYTPTSTA